MTDTALSRATGKVKWFSDQKGYGFIAREDSCDVFVHHSAIEMDGFRTLRQGEDVVYELCEGQKGPHAVHVMKRPEGED
ncbi:MAG: cold shock domain-containing protein [Candidatus Hydrogenedentes bacterium]|nr:cold shock domain-containing protein [Candidatus Hydrogenedentota bacterium]